MQYNNNAAAARLIAASLIQFMFLLCAMLLLCQEQFHQRTLKNRALRHAKFNGNAFELSINSVSIVITENKRFSFEAGCVNSISKLCTMAPWMKIVLSICKSLQFKTGSVKISRGKFTQKKTQKVINTRYKMQPCTIKLEHEKFLLWCLISRELLSYTVFNNCRIFIAAAFITITLMFLFITYEFLHPTCTAPHT
jgi:hypothetical protein